MAPVTKPQRIGKQVKKYDPDSASKELRTALDAARSAAEISRKYYAGNFTVTTKADRTPVTQADVECEQAIREVILAQFPGHGFFGEETVEMATRPSVPTPAKRRKEEGCRL